MPNKVNDLEEIAKNYKRELFEKFLTVGQGHPGSVFSMLDIVVTLYHGGILNYNKEKKLFDEKVLISKGHATVALYPILVNFGIIPKKEWDNWGKEKTILRVFGNHSIPGIDVTSGSLGHGIGVGAGIALSNKLKKNSKKVYTVISEGELYEGSTWEAMLFASHNKLDNLVIVIDVNSLIILGSTEDCLNLNPIKEKLDGMNFNIVECDGHNYNSLLESFNCETQVGKPTCIIANTVKGKGLSIMENKANWHYWNPLNKDQIEICRKELK
jgi:transketolase